MTQDKFESRMLHCDIFSPLSYDAHYIMVTTFLLFFYHYDTNSKHHSAYLCPIIILL